MNRFWNSLLGKPALSRYGGPRKSLAAYYEIGSLSDVGLTRTINQDNIGFVRFSDSRNILAVVADGMGGHQAGEVASRTAVETLQREFFNCLTNNNIVQALKDSFVKANTIIHQLAQNSMEFDGMGTTLVVLAIIDGCAYYANTGDSRLYLLRDGECLQLSQDQTVVAEMVKNGLLTPEAAKDHPDNHVITYAIGTKPNTKAEISKAPLHINIGDCFLLCSDGLYDLVNDFEIVQFVANNSSQDACRQLIALANARGGYDNISVIVIKILEQPNSVKGAPITRF